MGRPKKQIEEVNKIEVLNTEETQIQSEPEVEKVPTPKKPRTQKKKQICKVLLTNKNKITIDFNGFGIIIKDSSVNRTDKVEVNYESQIGKKGFKIISHKFI